MKHRVVTGSQPEWMQAREVLFFFNFQDVTDKGDVCQMVTQSSIELKKKNLEKGMKSMTQNEWVKHQNRILRMRKYID